MQGATGETVQRDLKLAAQLAAVFVRPLDVFDDNAGRLEPFTARETRAIAAHPAFRAPFNRALASTIPAETLPWQNFKSVTKSSKTRRRGGPVNSTLGARASVSAKSSNRRSN